MEAKRGFHRAAFIVKAEGGSHAPPPLQGAGASTSVHEALLGDHYWQLKLVFYFCYTVVKHPVRQKNPAHDGTQTEAKQTCGRCCR